MREAPPAQGRAATAAATDGALDEGAARHPFGSPWAWPLVLGAASAGGLTAALLADGWWDLLSALALALPLAVSVACIARRAPAAGRRPG